MTDEGLVALWYLKVWSGSHRGGIWILASVRVLEL